MLHKFIRRILGSTDVREPSKQKQVISHEIGHAKKLDEKQREVDLFKADLSFRESLDHRGEQIIRRWIA